MSFRKGERVVHGGHGLGEVEKMVDFEGSQFVRVTFPGDLRTMVPLEKAGRLLRRPMTKGHASRLLKDIKGSAPDPRHWRHRYRFATKVLVEGSVRERAALLGQFYAMLAHRPLSFAEKKMHEQAERSILTELAFVLKKDRVSLSTELLSYFKNHPTDAREPDEQMLPPADRTVRYPRQNGPSIANGWRYLGTFACTGTLHAGDRNWVLKDSPKSKGGVAQFISIKAKVGNWHAYQRDEDGNEALYAVANGYDLAPEVVVHEIGKIGVQVGDLAFVDFKHKNLPEVAENLRWEMSPAGTAFPWGVAAYTAAGDGTYPLCADATKGTIKALLLQL